MEGKSLPFVGLAVLFAKGGIYRPYMTATASVCPKDWVFVPISVEWCFISTIDRRGKHLW